MTISRSARRFCALAVLFVGISSTAFAANNDVHGRSLIGLGYVGHIGFEYNGVVHEMLGDKYDTQSNTSGIRSRFIVSTKSSFEHASTYWGKKSVQGMSDSGYHYALKVRRHGAHYTIFTNIVEPSSHMINGKRIYTPGTYRCDTLVQNILMAGGKPPKRTGVPRTVYDSL